MHSENITEFMKQKISLEELKEKIKKNKAIKTNKKHKEKRG